MAKKLNYPSPGAWGDRASTLCCVHSQPLKKGSGLLKCGWKKQFQTINQSKIILLYIYPVFWIKDPLMLSQELVYLVPKTNGESLFQVHKFLNKVGT